MLVHVLGLGGLPVDFRRLWTATLASNLADGIVAVTFALAAASLTTDPTLVAAVAVAGSLPIVLLALHAGAIADRTDRRQLLRAVQALRIVVMGGLVVVTVVGGLSIPVLMIAAFALAIGQAFYDTTSQAIVPMVAGSAQLTTANSRLIAAEVLTDTFLGPPIGGALVAIGIGLAWAGGALGYVIAIIGLATLRGAFRVERPPDATATMREDIVEGVTWLVRHPLQRTLTAMVGLDSFAASAAFAVLVLYAVAPGPMGLSEVGFGLLLSAIGVGGVIGSAIVPAVEARLGTARTLLGSQAVSACTFLVLAATAEVAAVAIAFVAFGLVSMAWNVTNVSLRQRFIPMSMYGRVHAGHRLVNRGAAVAGGLAGGLVGTWLGLPAVFLMAAMLMFVACLGAVVVNDRNVAAALAAAEPR